MTVKMMMMIMMMGGGGVVAIKLMMKMMKIRRFEISDTIMMFIPRYPAQNDATVLKHIFAQYVVEIDAISLDIITSYYATILINVT